MAKAKAEGGIRAEGPPPKTEAVRQALKALGRAADAAAIRRWVRETHGLELTFPQVKGL